MAVLAACGGPDLTAGRYQGMIELDQTELGFELGGRIASLAVVPGATVHRGQPIATLDDVIDRQTRAVRAGELDSAQADLAVVLAGARAEDVRAAEAQVTAARASEAVIDRDVDRERTLLATGAATGAHFEELTAQLARARGERRVAEERLRALTKGARVEEIARARARVATAQQTLELADRILAKHGVSSPVDGVVVEVYPKVGEVVATGVPVVAIVDRRRPYADVFLPVADLPRIRVGAAIALVVEGDPREVPGDIERVFPELEFTPRFVYSPRERPNLVARVRVRLDDRDGRLHAGQPAYVRLEAAREASR